VCCTPGLFATRKYVCKTGKHGHPIRKSNFCQIPINFFSTILFLFHELHEELHVIIEFLIQKYMNLWQQQTQLQQKVEVTIYNTISLYLYLNESTDFEQIQRRYFKPTFTKLIFENLVLNVPLSIKLFEDGFDPNIECATLTKTPTTTI
jgi:hypothetical protein